MTETRRQLTLRLKRRKYEKENYNSYSNSTIILKNGIDLSESTSPILSFWHKLSIPDGTTGYDYDFVEISVDGGTTWACLKTCSIVI